MGMLKQIGARELVLAVMRLTNAVFMIALTSSLGRLRAICAGEPLEVLAYHSRKLYKLHPAR
jgi:hypothetical protein